MQQTVYRATLLLMIAVVLQSPSVPAWNDETHLATSKAAGYSKWYNATGADLAKIKAGKREENNHYRNNHRGTVVTAEEVLAQADRYDTLERDGHLYGAIIASLRNYKAEVERGKYGEYHLAYCAHYVGDLSQPLHNTRYNPFNRKNHKTIDAIVDDEVLANIDKIKTYPLIITSEADLASEIARIANLTIALGYRLEDEDRLLTKPEAYAQLGHSAALFKAILKYIGR